MVRLASLQMDESNGDSIKWLRRAYEQGEIRRQNFEEHLGGKPDDITVIVCRVSQ